jgi:hypothetical protein
LLKSWLHEAAINFGIANLNHLGLPVIVSILKSKHMCMQCPWCHANA